MNWALLRFCSKAIPGTGAFVLVPFFCLFLFDLSPAAYFIMEMLTDRQSELLSGGRRGFSAMASRGGHGVLMSGRSMPCGSISSQSIYTSANQLNFAINIAVNGGSVTNTQINGLAIDSSL